MKVLIKIYSVILITLIIISCVSLTSYCLDIENLGEDIQNELNVIIDSDVKEVLNEIGITDFSPDKIFNISFENIANYFSETLKDKTVKYIRSFFSLLSIVIICSIFTCVFSFDKSDRYSTICSIIIIISAVNLISSSVSATVSVLELSGKFALSFAPIYTLVISLSGNTASALTYNTFVVFLGELISYVISLGLSDFIGVYFCLGISFAMNETANISRYVSVINKVISTILGFAASIFTGFLSIRSVLSVTLDSVSVKGIRFLISSMIPVVGSSISDAYSSLVGSINLIKGSVAFVGIIVIIIINLPIILENLVAYVSFSMLSYMAEGFMSQRTADILRFFASGIRILLLLCLFEMFIIIITVGIMLSAKGGV